MQVQLVTGVRPYSVYRTVVRAMREQRPLTIKYTRANGSHTVRTVEPLALTRNKNGDRYVRTIDWKTGEKRTFRLDRITAYGVGPAFGFRLMTEDDVKITDEDEKIYCEWAEEQQRLFVDHAFAHSELIGV